MSYTNRSDLANKNGTLAKIRCYDQGRIAPKWTNRSDGVFVGKKRDTVDLSVKVNYETAPGGNGFLGTAYATPLPPA
ncbi:MAG: hypothetical protein AAF620_15680 [Bacteroidota bacterium]